MSTCLGLRKRMVSLVPKEPVSKNSSFFLDCGGFQYLCKTTTAWLRNEGLGSIADFARVDRS